jgi:hypothetical protein
MQFVENSRMVPEELVSLFNRMFSFHRAAIHRFHCIESQ